jgi:dihydrofolate reductase
VPASATDEGGPMRDLIVTQNMTVDGVIEFLGDWFDPTAGSDDLMAVNEEHEAKSDAMLLGRKTYNDFKSFWPLQENDQTGITDYLNRTEKYVVSSTLTESDWENTTILSGPLVEEIQRIKNLPGQEITATGSITLVHALTEAGLVDEFRLFVYPVVSGAGRHLFDPTAPPPNLRLTSTQQFEGGIVLLTYRVDKAGTTV